MVIDDEKLIRNSLKRVFEKQSYIVEMAENGEEGIHKWREFRPDVVFLDWIMPKKNGLQVLESGIRSGCEAKVYIMSAYRNETTDLEKLNIEGFIGKPFESIDMLIRLLEDGENYDR